MKKILVLALTLALVIGCCATAQATTYLALGTGGTSGTYYALGADIASLWMANIADLDVTVQPTDASKDNIIFIEDGCLAAVGKHEELYESCEAYRKMVDLQRLEEEGGEHNA